MSDETLFEFPCSFPIKVMGKDTSDLHQSVRSIINKHVNDISDDAFQTRSSAQGTYVSITITITATDKQQLDNIYLDLTACEHVAMCL
ncbi:MAG: YbeD family protein [Gammaproteobacteria bacterium]